MIRILIILFLTLHCLSNKTEFINESVYYRCNETNPTITFPMEKFILFLTVLDCELTKFPDNLIEIFPNLQTIAIGNNGLESLDLVKIPAGESLKKFKINDGVVTSLKDQFCPNCHNLTELIIMNCKMRKIASNAFEGLDILEFLDLSKNIIDMLKEKTFASLKKLKFLKLSYNWIKIIHENLFVSNTLLTDILLEYNQISKLDKNTFVNIKNLKTLNFSYNKLVYVINLNSTLLRIAKNKLHSYVFEKKTSMLDVRYNHISKLICAENMEFTLVSLEIGYNFLESMDCLSRMVNLVNLNLEYNKFSHFPAQSFNELKHLSTLVLVQNPLKEFDVAIFGPNLKIKKLIITNISSYDNLKEKMSSLQLIELDVMEWNCSYVNQIKSTLKSQNIKMESWGLPRSIEDFVC